MSSALELATGLHLRRQGIIGWHILVADVEDLEHNRDQVTAYYVQGIRLNEADKEINLLVEYSDAPDLEKAMAATEFVDLLLRLAKGHPDFTIEAAIAVDLVIEGDTWSDYHMPVRTMVGSSGARVVILEVEGLHDLEERIPPAGRNA